MRKLTAWLLFLVPALGSAQVLEFEVTGIAQPTPVAIVPFGWEGRDAAMPMKVSTVITADLRRSGRFDPVPEEKMLQKPTDGADVDFQDWGFVGVEAVVVGKVIQTDDNLFTLQFQLFDVVARRQLLGFRMPRVTRATMRGAAHRAADMIYEKLTGIKGVFETRVAYVTAKRQGDGQLYSLVVADHDGFNQYTIMESTDPIMSPAWSPDSRQLAYVSFEGDKSSIWVQTLRTGNRFRVSSRPGINGAPSFSPDGRKLVVTLGGVDGNPDIYVLDINSRNATRLTTHRAIDTEGSWSPDGQHIYFTSDRSGGPQIYRVPAAGGTPERIAADVFLGICKDVCIPFTANFELNLGDRSS